MKEIFFNGLNKFTKFKDNILKQIEFENPESSIYQKIFDNLSNSNTKLEEKEEISSKYFDFSSEKYPNNGIFFLALVSFHQKNGYAQDRCYLTYSFALLLANQAGESQRSHCHLLMIQSYSYSSFNYIKYFGS